MSGKQPHPSPLTTWYYAAFFAITFSILQAWTDDITMASSWNIFRQKCFNEKDKHTDGPVDMFNKLIIFVQPVFAEKDPRTSPIKVTIIH